MVENDSRGDRVVEVPEADAQLEAFKGALLRALSHLPGAARSEFARRVEEQGRKIPPVRGGNRVAAHLEGFARIARLVPPSVVVEVVKRPSRD